MFFFIAGTDTGIGKTYVSKMLLKTWNAMGLKTIGLKPIASGHEWVKRQFVNPDAFILQQSASVFLPYQDVSPYSFSSPIAPHIAAKKKGIHINIDKICQHIHAISHIPHDRMLIEGVGGLMVPLNRYENQISLIQKLNIPLIFVIGLKLGCLNHALLSLDVMKKHNLLIKGWIVNQIDPLMDCVNENVQTLQRAFGHQTYLGTLPFNPTLKWCEKLPIRMALL